MSKILVISGPPGVGKTKVAEALSKLTHAPIFDLDSLIEQAHGIPLAHYIQQVGWKRFREQESKTLLELSEILSAAQSNTAQFLSSLEQDISELKPQAIVSVGGGCLLTESNRAIARKLGSVFSLWADETLIYQRLKRRAKYNPDAHPLPIDSLVDLNQLLTQRLPSYLDSDAWIEVYEGESPQQVATRIRKAWFAYHLSPPPHISSDQKPWYAPPILNDLGASKLANKLKDSNDSQPINHLSEAKLDLSLASEIQLHDYPIYLASALQDQLIDKILEWLRVKSKAKPNLPQLAIFSDEIVARLYGGELVGTLQSKGIQAHLLSFPVGEQSKQLRVVEALSTQLLKLNFTRSDCLLALGGGVSGDLCGFLASIYLRGISWGQVPTSLLAQVDSSIGAKTAVNHPLGKNLLGSFYRPDWVWIDESYLKTLPLRHLKAGWVEALKHGLIADHRYFNNLDELTFEDCFHDYNVMGQLIKTGLNIKAKIVAQDEREQGQRALLNLGHTLGHAIEKAEPSLLHGEAVALGISFTVEYAHIFSGLPLDQVHKVKKSLHQHELDINWREYINEQLLNRLAFDKKRSGKQLKFVTLKAIGQAQLELISLEDFTDRVLELSRKTLLT